MEPHKKRLPICFASLHVLHISLSIGLIVAVVHNQLVNNARFETLEVKCDCTRYNSDELSPQDKRTGRNETNNHLKSKKLIWDWSSKKHHPITKREVLIVLDANNTEHQEPVNNTSKDYHDTANKTSDNRDPSVKLTEKVNTRPNANLKKKLQTTDETLLTKILFQEKRDLISCLDEVKVIIDHYVKTRENDTQQKSVDCGALKGLTGDTGDKGDRGEKGCAGTSFAPPLFQPSSKKFVFNEGESHVLSCNATGNPAVKIKWHRDKKIIRGESGNMLHHYNIKNRDITPFGPVRAQSVCPSEQPHPVIHSSLIIRNLNGLDTGTYSCKAHNFMGTSSYDIQILVQEYVRYTTLPSNTTVVQGENVELSCRASGVPAPTVTWYRKDGGPMPAYYNFSNRDLQIQNITKEEEGTFTCLATNVLGSKTTEATITVNVYPKFVSPIEKLLTINESGNLMLPCNATGFPAPSVYCSKTNGSLPVGRYFNNSQILIIFNVQYEDRGEYVCTAINSVGRIVSKVQVIVQVAPKITKQPNMTEYGFRGKTKVLMFRAFAIPAAIIAAWRKPMYGDASRRIREENGSLVIENVQYTDSGLYQAVARNILGQVKVETFLVVRDAVPAAIRSDWHLQPAVSLIEGFNLTKTCFAVGIPTPQITWKYKDNTTLSSTTSSRLDLRITNVTRTDSGRYTCAASNEFGFEQQQFELKIISKWMRVKIVRNQYQDYYNRGTYRSISSSSGELLSHRHLRQRSLYDNNVDVRWKLTSNARIKVKFVQFLTEACCDKLKIYDGASDVSPFLGEFSGDSLPPTIISSSNNLYITFTTDSAKQKTGFLALYSAVV